MRAENAATHKVHRRPVVIAGAGLSGMVLALDMARRGQRVTLLERTDGSLKGSRAITYSPTTLEILCTLDCGDRPLEAAIRWFTGTEFLAAASCDR
jgi:3-(3-hydroxy-phenyl)propionate hydroxylase